MQFDVSLILWISVILQCIAVFLALRLIPVSSRSLAWIILSSAFLLMAARRTMSLLYAEGVIQGEWLRALTTETVALIISLLIVTGVYQIRRIFVHLQEDALEIRKLSLAVEQNPNTTLILDTSGHIEYANPAYFLLTGKSPGEVTGQLPENLKSENISKETLRELWETLKTGHIWEHEFRYKGIKDYRWERAKISSVKNPKGEITHYVATLEDITQQKEHSDKLEYIAMHDTLTGLPNRTMFSNLLAHEIIKAGKTHHPLAVMLLDLNNFKQVNDALGHSMGDNVLKEIAARLQSRVGKTGIVARIVGDEFLILLPSTNYSECLEVVSRITTGAETPIIIDGKKFEIGVSIGIAMYPDDEEDHNTLLKQAERAMYAAKESSRKFLRYSKKPEHDELSALELSSEIRTAVDNDQLLLFFQPKINLETGDTDSVEALVRWQHPKHGLLDPEKFIPLAEKTGHIVLITKWVIHNSLKKLAEWNSAGHSIGLSINISARDLLYTKLSKFIEDEIQLYHVDPSFLTLEITESTIMMYSQQTMDTLNRLKDTGIHFSIDDFGTGYSSLQNLKELPVSELKIDKSFILNMLDNDDDAIIVRSTIDLAHNLGLKVVAEGIEEKDTYDILVILGCDYGQGFLFKKPMPHEALLKYL